MWLLFVSSSVVPRDACPSPRPWTLALAQVGLLEQLHACSVDLSAVGVTTSALKVRTKKYRNGQVSKVTVMVKSHCQRDCLGGLLGVLEG